MKTSSELKEARRRLLAIANCYEPVKRKQLRGVFYDGASGRYRYIGQVHDYSWFPQRNNADGTQAVRCH